MTGKGQSDILQQFIRPAALAESSRSFIFLATDC